MKAPWCRFQLGLWPGMALSAVDTVLLRGKAPWTLHHRCAASTPNTASPQHMTCWLDHSLLAKRNFCVARVNFQNHSDHFWQAKTSAIGRS